VGRLTPIFADALFLIPEPVWLQPIRRTLRT
jgi:hypothetical protein